jgi:hypothetical protein
MRPFFTFAVLALGLFCWSSVSAVDQADHASLQKLANKDILEMQAAGLSSEVIAEKIRASTCDFDTAPTSLAELKRLGVPDAVILAMLRCRSPQLQPAPQPLKAVEAGVPVPASAFKGYSILAVESFQVLDYRNGTKPYAEILAMILSRLDKALATKGAKRVEVRDGECCRIKVELLQASYNIAAWRGMTVKLLCNVYVEGTGYSRRIEGVGGPGQFHNYLETRLGQAADKCVASAVEDQQLLHLATTGKM